MPDPTPIPPNPSPDPTPTPRPKPTPFVMPQWLTIDRLWLVVLSVVILAKGCVLPQPPGPGPNPPAPEAYISLPGNLSGDVGRMVVIDATTTAKDVVWWTDPDLKGHLAYSDKDSKQALFTGPEGKYKVLAYTVQSGKATLPSVCTVTIGKPPVPPDPGPGPGPNPPLPVDGLHVLIVHKAKWKPDAAQLDAINGGDVQAYLKSHCIKVGTVPEFRIYPDDADLKNETQVWKDAMAKALKDRTNPDQAWVLIAGKTGTSQPLPADQPSMLKLLQTYGGN